MHTLHILLAAFFIALIITAIGFKKTVWFISIGYTFSITALCMLFTLFHHASFGMYNYLHQSMLLVWSARLGYFLIQRERNEQYNSNVQDQTGAAERLPIIAKLGIWVLVSILYVCMFSPGVFATQQTGQSSLAKMIAIVCGLLVGFSGIIIEATADYQKSVFKKTNPKDYCNTGLYQWVRCPNYLGEIMVWLGNFIIGLSFYSGLWQWGVAIVGCICIILIMMGSAKRLEKKQGEKYGSSKIIKVILLPCQYCFHGYPCTLCKKLKCI